MFSLAVIKMSPLLGPLKLNSIASNTLRFCLILLQTTLIYPVLANQSQICLENKLHQNKGTHKQALTSPDSSQA